MRGDWWEYFWTMDRRSARVKRAGPYKSKVFPCVEGSCIINSNARATSLTCLSEGG
jgi:hypothetical protein